MPGIFFDTNVVVYSDDISWPAKKERAGTLIAEHLKNRTAVFSLQVLQEYSVAATRKLHVPAEVAQRKIEILARARIVRLDAADIISAIELHRLNQLSFRDVLIVHAARAAGTAVLFSEDLQDGAVAGGVRVINPFVEQREGY